MRLCDTSHDVQFKGIVIGTAQIETCCSGFLFLGDVKKMKRKRKKQLEVKTDLGGDQV